MSSTGSTTSSPNLITVTIEFVDGSKEDFTISSVKPGGALIELAVRAKGRAIAGLTKKGVSIPLREMIKYIPLVSGDVLKEIPTSSLSTANIPKSAIQNTILRNQVQSGTVSANDVMELRVLYNTVIAGKSYDDILVKKNTTLDEFKKIISEKRGKLIKELGPELRSGNPLNELFGWTDLLSRARKYDGTASLESLGLRDGMIVLEYDLPKIPTKSNIYKQKLYRGNIPQKDGMQIEFLLQGRPDDPNRVSVFLYIPKTITIDELKEYISDELQRPIQDIGITYQPYIPVTYTMGWNHDEQGNPVYDGTKQFQRYLLSHITRIPIVVQASRPQPIPSFQYSSSSSTRSSVPTDECDKLLQGLSIIDKATFKEWARKGGHPDKTPHQQGTKEWEEANELFKKVYGCCEKKGYLKQKGGKRKSRRSKHRSKRTRKQ